VTDPQRFEFRTALALINYEEDNCATLIELLQKCAMSSFFLGHEVGKKLLAFMFTLHPSLVDRLHEAVKYQLAAPKPHMTAAYAEIYYQVREEIDYWIYLILLFGCVNMLNCFFIIYVFLLFFAFNSLFCDLLTAPFLSTLVSD
jgi:hypothetical protein